MKKAVIVVAIYLLADVRALYAACTTDACKRAVAWKSGYAAIILDDAITPEEYFGVLESVRANGGAVAIEAERILLGWVPAAAAGKVRAARGVRAVTYERVARPEAVVRPGDAVYALTFFNKVVSGEYEDVVEAGLAIKAKPLTGCIVERPTSGRRPRPDLVGGDRIGGFEPAPAENEGAEERTRAHNGTSALDRRARVEPTYWYYKPYQNPNMLGRVTVQLFLLDSDGGIDPNLYTWTAEHYGAARNQVLGAFTFWADQAAARGKTLSFRVKSEDPFSRYTRTSVPTRTRYEPITHGIVEDYLWVNDALDRLGYGSNPITPDNVYTQNEAFNRHRKADTIYGPFDAAFSVYVVYNPPPASTHFADGYRAYAMWDGPFTTVMWDSAGWGPHNLGRVLTHETGHIFWACDEYYDEASDTGCRTCEHCLFDVGPRNERETPWIKNLNCDRSGCRYPQQSCMMDDISAALCADTPAQIGW